MAGHAMKRRWLPACVLAVLVAASCDDGFAPLAPSRAGFSVFGYLDASADTQWIRVMPIRPLLTTTPDSIDATVTLEHLGTGQVIELRDSLFRFTNYLQPDLGSEGVYAHNFWTTERIEPGATYRFSARRNGVPAAEAIIGIPDEYATEVWISQRPNLADYVRLTGLKHLPFVSSITRFLDGCGITAHSETVRPGRPDGDVFMIPVTKAPVPPRGACGPPRILGREIRAAASAVPWPTGTIYSPSGLAITEEISNVSNAIGFIGGVLTTRIPYEDCSTYGGPTPDHCVLRYDAASATLSGIARETRCADGPLDSATVTLRQLDGALPLKLRMQRTDRSGHFWFGALESGTRYAIRVRAVPELDPFWGEVDIHTIHEDTIVFARGERKPYDVSLERFTAC